MLSTDLVVGGGEHLTEPRVQGPVLSQRGGREAWTAAHQRAHRL